MRKIWYLLILSVFLLLPYNSINAHSYTGIGIKQVYLTFDDGPSNTVTPKVLDILKSYGIKATFFVAGDCAEKNPQILRRIFSEGHSIGIHCYAHNYKRLYSSLNAFEKDIKKCIGTVKNIVPDCNPKYMRFPGGSFGLDKKYRDAVTKMGLIAIDWNCVNGDAEKTYDYREAVNIVKSSSKGKNRAVLLMHDNKKVTARSLSDIILNFKQSGYVFCKF